MNERIRELAEQALQLVADERTDGDESRLNTDSYHVKDLIQAKFAELIVKECISVMNTTAKEAQENFTYMDNDVPTTAHQFEIRKHFGVEE